MTKEEMNNNSAIAATHGRMVSYIWNFAADLNDIIRQTMEVRSGARL